MRPVAALICLLLLGCSGGSGTTQETITVPTTTPVNPESPSGPTPVTYDIDAKGAPHFASSSHIDLSVIDRISMFRSGFGHDYHDAFESCRSMKHYFQPRSDVDWSAVPIFSPVDGRVWMTRAEQTFGTQVLIRSSQQPAFTFILFHVNPTIRLDTGTVLHAGQEIGTHIGSQTLSDIAVGVDTPTGYKLVSFFDVMTDELFARYAARGVSSRSSAIITRASRDSTPLACDGEAFVGADRLPVWTSLK